QSYQAPTQQNQVVPLSELEKIKRMNDANIKAMQTQINNVKNELRNKMKTSIQASMSNQNNELKNMMASFFQMNTASTLVRDLSLATTLLIRREDECVKETLTGLKLSEFTIKVPPPLVQKSKPPSQRNFVMHQRDPLHPISLILQGCTSKSSKKKMKAKFTKFGKCSSSFISISLLLMLSFLSQNTKKCLKLSFSNKEKLLELANTPLNENCSAVILKKLAEKLGDPGKFLILCGFSELKSKALPI
nr:reverse transcriptase domain-containing protein [Tanacetum cinerariifolium]